MRACARLDLGDYYDFSWISFAVGTGDMPMGPYYEYRFMRGQDGCPKGGNGLGSGQWKCGKGVIRMNPIIIQPVVMNTL